MKDKKLRSKEATQRWQRSHPERYRESVKRTALKKLYGITLEEYKSLVEKQRGLCLLCGEPGDKLVVDHDHKSGRVRGLLHQQCNVLLGCARDDSKILSLAIVYLAKGGAA